MSRPSASARGTARVAVLGSASPCGARVRAALGERGVPGSRVDLFVAGDAAEPVLSEYDGEARLIQVAGVEEIASREVVFLCEPGEVVDRLVAMAETSVTTIDVCQSRPAGAAAALVHVGVNPDAARERGGLFAVPHSLSALLLDLLLPIERELGCTDAVAMILRPAADYGEEGVEELRQQTVHLLSFSQPRTEVFGRQLAFNLLPGSASPDGEAVERRVAAEVATLLGWGESRLAVGAAVVPVFYGHGLQLRVRCGASATEERLREVLRSAGLDDADDRLTPMDVVSDPGRIAARVRADGLGGFWIWAVAGEAQGRDAELAVALAASLYDL